MTRPQWISLPKKILFDFNCSPGPTNMKACVSFLKFIFKKNVISWLTTWNYAYIEHYALSQVQKSIYNKSVVFH